MARILLIHGAMGGAWCWERVLPGLRAAGHEPVAIDLPGQGADRTPLPEITLAHYADAVSAALSELEGPVLLAGHSMGGMVITQAAARHPEKLAGLVYVAAFLPQPGQSLIDITHQPEAAGDSVQANIVVNAITYALRTIGHIAYGGLVLDRARRPLLRDSQGEGLCR